MTLAPATFSWVRELVLRETSIVLEPGKEYLVESRLLPLARKAGLPDVESFVTSVRTVPDPRSRQALVEAMTTNETSWFRDGKPFAALQRIVVPELRPARSATRRLRIWSAACSTGQEAYSTLMVLAGMPELAGWTAEVLATDIADNVLERTRAGRYSQLEVNRGLPAPMMVRHMRRDGTDWVVDEELRRKVTTRRLNLAAPFPPMGPFDVVFLRNVLIYFDLATKKSILDRVADVMAPDGFLVLGAAETTLGITERYTRVPGTRAPIHRPVPRTRAGG